MFIYKNSNYLNNNFVNESLRGQESRSNATNLAQNSNYNFYNRKVLKAKLKHIAKKLLPNTQKNAWLAFEYFVNSNNENSIIYPSHKFLAKKNRYSERTSMNVMNLLKKLNLIKKVRRGCMKSNRYEINWFLVFERPDLLEDYAPRVKCKTCTLYNTSKEVVNINNIDNNNFDEKFDIIRSDNTLPNVNNFKEPEDTREIIGKKRSDNVYYVADFQEDNLKISQKTLKVNFFWFSKANEKLLESKGIHSFLQKQAWNEQFKEVIRTQKPWNGDETWDFRNANYAFGKFIRTETRLKAAVGEKRYIPLTTRTKYYQSDKTKKVLKDQRSEMLKKDKLPLQQEKPLKKNENLKTFVMPEKEIIWLRERGIMVLS
jgi:hypothetical protein